MTAIATFSLVALDCPDTAVLARFYSAITGYEIDPDHEDEDWVQLRPPKPGMTTIAFQEVADHQPPQWPGQEHPQQLHIDFDVPDLDAGEEQVLALGARKTEEQPRPESFRVYLDPAGHPFCLVLAKT